LISEESQENSNLNMSGTIYVKELFFLKKKEWCEEDPQELPHHSFLDKKMPLAYL